MPAQAEACRRLRHQLEKDSGVCRCPSLTYLMTGDPGGHCALVIVAPAGEITGCSISVAVAHLLAQCRAVVRSHVAVFGTSGCLCCECSHRRNKHNGEELLLHVHLQEMISRRCKGVLRDRPRC